MGFYQTGVANSIDEKSGDFFSYLVNWNFGCLITTVNFTVNFVF